MKRAEQLPSIITVLLKILLSVMENVTTKAIAKVAAVATGLAMATSMLSFAPMVHAAGLTSDQVNQIIGLLKAFGADATTLANVQASLTGSTPVVTGNSGSCAITKDLTVGTTGAQVTALQNALKAGGYMSANATGSFGPLTQAGVVAWQKAKGISPAAGYFGAKSRAVFCGSSSNPGTPVVNVGTGTGLKVMIAPDSPNGVALVQAQAAGELGRFVFANPTGSAITVTNLAFNRIGVSNDSTLTNVYLYTGAVRLTDSAGVSNSAFNFNNPTGLFVVPAGSTYTVSVRADIANTTSGQQIGVKLVSATASTALDSSVSLPIVGGLQTVSAASLSTVDFNSTTLPSVSSVDPQADYTVWQNTVTIGTRAVTLKSFAVRNLGSMQSGDVTNFRLYVDGVKVGNPVAKVDSNNMVTFDLAASPVRLETGGRVIKVIADVVGGASRTFQMSLRYAADALFYDTDLGQPVLSTANSSTFSARSATSATINSVSTSAPSVTRSTDSPTAAVANSSANVKWATFKVIANGEDVKVDNLNVTADTSSSGAGLDNGKVFVNGVQVGSTKDLAEFGGTTTNFTFGSSFIVKVGQTAVVDIYADAKTSASANLTSGETVRIYLGVGSSNANGQVSLSSVNFPASEVTGNAITVAASSLSATKYSGYGNQTLIAGAQNVKLGSFTLSAGSSEGVNVNTIDIGFASTVSSTVSDVVVKDHDTGAMYGTSRATVSTSAQYSGSVDIPASGTKTFDIYANIKTGANVGAIPATTVTTSTSGTGKVTGSSVSVSSAPTLQTMTIGSANLTVTVNAGSTPDIANVVAGQKVANVPVLNKVGAFRFTTQYSSYAVDKINVKVPASSATSVSAVTVKYQDVNGATQTASQALALSSGGQTYSTATFTGLSFYIPADSNRDLEVYVSVPSTADGATSGAAISAVLDADEGFNAIDSSGSADTTVAAADVASTDASGKGQLVVRKTIPTLSAGTAPDAALATGANQVLGRFNVTADAAGDVDWDQVVFTVNKTAAITLGATTTVAVWDITSGSAVQVAGTFATTTGSLVGGNDSLQNVSAGLLHFRPTTAQTVASGSTRKYELRGTVGGTAAGANNVSVSIANPSSTALQATAFATAAGTLGTAANASFVWSDWSSPTNHAANALTATDWANDYLVKSLPLTIGSRTLNF